MWEALEALNHDLERDHLAGIVAAGSMIRRAYIPAPWREEEAVMQNDRDPGYGPCGAGGTRGGA